MCHLSPVTYFDRKKKEKKKKKLKIGGARWWTVCYILMFSVENCKTIGLLKDYYSLQVFGCPHINRLVLWWWISEVLIQSSLDGWDGWIFVSWGSGAVCYQRGLPCLVFWFLHAKYKENFCQIKTCRWIMGSTMAWGRRWTIGCNMTREVGQLHGGLLRSVGGLEEVRWLWKVVTSHVSHVTCYLSPVTNNHSHSQRPSLNWYSHLGIHKQTNACWSIPIWLSIASCFG